MQRIARVVRKQRVALAAVQALDFGIGDAVGVASDGLAEEGAVVLVVLFGGGEAEHDVGGLGAEDEGLEDGAEGEEGEDGVLGHGCDGFLFFYFLRVLDRGKRREVCLRWDVFGRNINRRKKGV